MSIKLNKLRDICLSCRDCPLGGRKIEPKCISNVFSNMNAAARIMVVGQNPGRDEVKQGEPFVGVSGKFFNQEVKDILHLERSSFYISNVVRCFTPENRKPLNSELEACRSILDDEIRIINPALIIALGSVAFERLTGMHGILKHHGETIISPRYLVPVIALLHPSPFNTNNPANREKFRDGLREVGKFLQKNGK